MSDDRLATLFVASTGDYYTASELCQLLAEDRWRFCMRDEDTDRELFENERGELVMVQPTDAADVDAARRPSRRDA